MTRVTALLLVLLSTSTVSAQRFCNSPACAMCNALERQTYVAPQYMQFQVEPQVVSPAMQPTPDAAIDAMLKELSLTENDVLYDLGCGDGRVLIAAVKQYGCRCVGIEINPTMAERARYRVRMAETSMVIRPRRIRIVTGDATKFKLDGATAVTMYLYQDTVKVLATRLHGKRVASFIHNLPGLHARRVMVGQHQIYVSIPLQVSQSRWPGWFYLN